MYLITGKGKSEQQTSFYYIQIAINIKLWDHQISARGNMEQSATTQTGDCGLNYFSSLAQT